MTKRNTTTTRLAKTSGQDGKTSATLPVGYWATAPILSNLQRMELTGARVRRPVGHAGRSRGASIPSGVEPARRRFVKWLSYAFCFFRCPLASSTYAELPHLGQSHQGLPRSKSQQMMTDQKHVVQSSAALARHTSGSNLTPGSLNLRKVRRAAAGLCDYEGVGATGCESPSGRRQPTCS
jgi:hypothetical protein